MKRFLCAQKPMEESSTYLLDWTRIWF